MAGSLHVSFVSTETKRREFSQAACAHALRGLADTAEIYFPTVLWAQESKTRVLGDLVFGEISLPDLQVIMTFSRLPT